MIDVTDQRLEAIATEGPEQIPVVELRAIAEELLDARRAFAAVEAAERQVQANRARVDASIEWVRSESDRMRRDFVVMHGVQALRAMSEEQLVAALKHWKVPSLLSVQLFDKVLADDQGPTRKISILLSKGHKLGSPTLLQLERQLFEHLGDAFRKAIAFELSAMLRIVDTVDVSDAAIAAAAAEVPA